MRLHGSRQPYTPIYNKAGELREEPEPITRYGAMAKRLIRS